MPTIGIQPSLTSTKAIGAVLLHQFARDRFSQADIDQSLITKAEAEEHLDDLAASLLHNNKEDTTQSEHNNTSANITNLNSSSGSVQGDVTKYNTFADSTNANSTLNGTVYHSMNTGDGALSPLDELQSLPTFASYGQELRKIAEEFERDRLRHLVKKRAEQVKLETINKEDFFALLKDLFQDTITREKIVILFFFCTDVAVRAAHLATDLAVKFMGWSFSYIIDIVCNVVHQLGGWDKVLFQRLPSVLLSCVAALAICSLLIYIRKSLRD